MPLPALKPDRAAAALGVRTLAVDENNDVWVGGWMNRVHQKVNGITGGVVPGTRYPATGNGEYGGYGGFIDASGTLWSAAGVETHSPLLRFFPSQSSGGPACRSWGGYGLAINPRSQDLWYAGRNSESVYRYSNGGAYQAAIFHGAEKAQGIVVDYANDVWVAHVLHGDPGDPYLNWPSLATTVGHIDADGPGGSIWVGNVHLSMSPAIRPGPTGVGVDSNSKVWVSCFNAGKVMRINTSAGPLGPGGTRIGAVDLTVDLGDGSDHQAPFYDCPAMPYSFSDMTGFVFLGAASPSGVWDFVQDGGRDNRNWSKLSWTADTPGGTSVTVEVRAANTVAGLPGRLGVRNDFRSVPNGSTFTPPVVGRYLEVRVTLARAWAAQSPPPSPVLRDLTVHCPSN
jgi:hypothetical protein